MFRLADIASWDVTVAQERDGVMRVRPTVELGAYPVALTERLDYWARVAPGRTFLARRAAGGGEWVRLTYADFARRAREVAAALLGLGLVPERPIAILSGNDLEHAVLAVAAMYAGIPYAPISPAYSLLSQDFAKLRHIFARLQPGLVFASDGTAFARAIEQVVPASTPLVMVQGEPRREALRFAELDGAEPVRWPAIGPDTVAKILFTSGSTGVPKGVINTQRMLTSNQEMLSTVFRFFRQTPPVICDWLPWHHTFGGNHNFGIALYNGGTFYLDDGKPAGPGLAESLRNLREIAPTVYFNVPKGFEGLVAQMREDAGLRESFFSRLEMNFYAAASLPQHVWDALDELAVATCGHRVPMLTGLGATESAPFALCADMHTARAGVVGLPVPGVELKLVPVGEKLEARLRGPNITPGYWREDELTRNAFDDEGFYRMGDALRPLEPGHPRAFVFDGRLSEDFKLSTGTWVSVGPLRARFLQHGAPYVRDVVMAGHDRGEVTALIFPDPEEYRRLQESGREREVFQELLRTFAAQATGSSQRIARGVILDEPPSLEAGEITDKGSLNQRAVLARRAQLVEALYATEMPDFVLDATWLSPARRAL